MNPELILATLKSLADAAAEAFRFAQTPQGQALIERSLKDRAAWDKAVRDLGDWFGRLLKGQV